MFKDNGEVIHFTNPKVQASLGSNTFAISGPSDTKCKRRIFFFLCEIVFFCFLALQDMLPTIMSQMGMSTDSGLIGKGDQHTGDGQSGTTNEQAGAEGDDEVPGMYPKKNQL
jgi:nascent polypeptide-associated complex subunit beta